jgi:hypothetical protein
MRLILLFGGFFLAGVLVYITFQQMRIEYEVCVTFKGGTHCARARGASSAEAIRSAQEIDCQMLANGRDENMACLENPPSSVRQLK